MGSQDVGYFTSNVDKLTLSDPLQSSQLDPWLENESNHLSNDLPAQDSLDSSTTQRADTPKEHTSIEILNQFDPLAISTGDETRRAWGTSQGRPMIPNTASDPPTQATTSQSSTPISSGIAARADSAPTPVPVEVPAATSSNANSITPVHTSIPSVGSGFSSLANLARSFSLPRVRIRSVDIVSPPNLITPNTISSFAQQQSRPGTPNGPVRQIESATEQPASPPASISADESAESNLRKEHARQKDEPPPFDFQLFLDQMKSKSAEPVAKYLRSFLSNFAKKSLAVSEQIKVINEFLNFIAVRMREAEIWRNATDDEFDNALEAMEKLVMNRLYEFTFTPQLAEAQPPRPITTDDLERDRVLAQRIALFGWIEERHLDLPDPAESGGFLMFAQQELLKINHYKAPRDKLICVLNCCKVIFGLIRHLHKEENADSFVPVLIFVVLKSNPPNLISNIEYIQRFRNPQKLQSEAGYYLSSLMGAVHFIETMDHASLSNITAEEFERHVEFAIHDLPASPLPLEKPFPMNPPTSSRPSTPARPSPLGATSYIPSTPIRPARPDTSITNSPHAGEESAQPLALSLGGLGSGNLADDTRRLLQKTGDAIGKPINALGRLLGEALDGLDNPPGAGASGLRRESIPSVDSLAGEGVPTPQFQTPYKPRVRNVPTPSGTPIVQMPSTVNTSGRSIPDSRYGTPSRVAADSYPTRPGGELGYGFGSSISPHLTAQLAESEGVSRTPTPALDLAGIQAEIDMAHARAADAALGTLMQIFPAVEREVVEWVLEAEGGDLGRSIEKLLEVGGGG